MQKRQPFSIISYIKTPYGLMICACFPFCLSCIRLLNILSSITCSGRDAKLEQNLLLQQFQQCTLDLLAACGIGQAPTLILFHALCLRLSCYMKGNMIKQCHTSTLQKTMNNATVSMCAQCLACLSWWSCPS